MSLKKPPQKKAVAAVRKIARPRSVTAKKTSARAPRKISAAKAPSRSASKLPEAYDTQRLLLIARDPRWLYAHWDFTRAQRQRFGKLSADGCLILRIHADAPDGLLVVEINLPDDAQHWFVPVGRGDSRFFAELGYRQKRGGWTSLARSNPVTTPSDTISPDTSLMFATIPPDVPFRKMFETLGAVLAGEATLIEAVQQLHAAGHGGLAELSVFPGEQRWSPERAQRITRIAGAQRIRRRIARELSSLAAANILPGEADTVTSPAGGWSGDLT